MCKWGVAILMCAASIPAFCQSVSSRYEPGTIVSVTAHQAEAEQQDREVVRYDVSVKIGNTVYVVLYTPPNGYNGVEYAAGINKLFLVGSDTLTFNSNLIGKTVLPILRQQTLATQAGLDWSRAPGEYFSMKMQHLSESLNLSEDQQRKMKPILEQESGELGHLWGNPVVSRKEKLNTLEKVVRSSDEKIKPFLSQVQQEKLLEMRKEQKLELKKLLTEKTGKRN